MFCQKMLPVMFTVALHVRVSARKAGHLHKQLINKPDPAIKSNCLSQNSRVVLENESSDLTAVLNTSECSVFLLFYTHVIFSPWWHAQTGGEISHDTSSILKGLSPAFIVATCEKS